MKTDWEIRLLLNFEDQEKAVIEATVYASDVITTPINTQKLNESQNKQYFVATYLLICSFAYKLPTSSNKHDILVSRQLCVLKK